MSLQLGPLRLRIDPFSGFYQRLDDQPRPNLAQRGRLDPTSLIHKKRAPVIAEPEKIDPLAFGEMLTRSKCFQRVLAKGAPIETIPLLAVINPIHDYSLNYQLPKGRDSLRKRLIPKEVLSNNVSSVINPRSFARDFINGQYPVCVAVKPHASAGGDGILKLTREADCIKIKMHCPYVAETKVDGLPALTDVYDYAKTQEAINIDVNDHVTNLTIKLEPRLEAENILAEIVTRALTTKFPHFSNEEFAYTDLQSGLVEPYYNLLKLDGKVIEGRYYVMMHNNVIRLARGQRMDGTPVPSYLKIGLGGDFVNGGDIHSEWPLMHDEIIKRLGLSVTTDEFNTYMLNLLAAQVTHVLENLANLHDEPLAFHESINAAGFTIDVAWSEHELMQVPKEGGGVITVPKPILMETGMKLI